MPDLMRENLIQSAEAHPDWVRDASPRVREMIRSLVTPDTRVGPTTVDGLKHLLLDGNDDDDDETFTVLGGVFTLNWAFAPREFGHWTKVVIRLRREGLTEDEVQQHPEQVAALAARDAAIEESLTVWAESHSIDADGEDG